MTVRDLARCIGRLERRAVNTQRESDRRRMTDYEQGIEHSQGLSDFIDALEAAAAAGDAQGTEAARQGLTALIARVVIAAGARGYVAGKDAAALESSTPELH